MQLNDTDKTCGPLQGGFRIWGSEDADGWIRVGPLFVPSVLNGHQMLIRQDIEAARSLENGTPRWLWLAGPWSACAAACGDSLAVRVITCPPCLSDRCEEASGSRPRDTTYCADRSQCKLQAGLGANQLIMFGVPVGTLLCCLVILLVFGSLGKGRRSRCISCKMEDERLKTTLGIVPQADQQEALDPQPISPILPEIESSGRICHCGHPVEAFIASGGGDSSFCGNCSQEVQEGVQFWFCRQCRLEVCDACCDAVLAAPRRLCRRRHELICSVVSWNCPIRCAECRQSAMPGAAVWSCAQCGYDACDQCCRRLCGERPMSQCPAGHDLMCMADGPPCYSGRARCHACAVPNLGGAGRALYFHCAICKYDLCMDCATPPPLPPPASGSSFLGEIDWYENSDSETVTPFDDDNNLSHQTMPPNNLGFVPRMTSREEAAMKIIDKVTSERARILQRVHKVPRCKKSIVVIEAERLKLQPEYIGATKMLQNRFADMW